MNKILLRYDSRDKLHYQKFGQAVQFPDEINFDTAQYDDVQPIGDVKCTCYTTCDIAEDQQNLTFDIDDLWKRIPSNQFGADPRDVLGEAVKNGLLPQGKAERLKSWASYWRADFGMHDKFDNLRSAMIQAKSPVGVATYWYSNWPSGETLPIGVGPTNGHMYSVEGWKQINGKPHLIIDAWIGRKLYMSREVFNEAMKPYGMQSWVLSTSEIDARMEKTLTETVKDLIINIIIKLRELLALKQPTPKVDNSVEKTVDNSYNEVKEKLMEKDYLTPFCNAIAEFEGGPGDLNHKNNNPGNLRSVKGPFLKFKTWEEGMAALRDYVTRAATGKHKAYKPEFTILQFFNVYAPSSDNNHPEVYANFVAKKVGVPITFKIKDLV